jgi:hypothetical protein
MRGMKRTITRRTKIAAVPRTRIQEIAGMKRTEVQAIMVEMMMMVITLATEEMEQMELTEAMVVMVEVEKLTYLRCLTNVQTKGTIEVVEPTLTPIPFNIVN